MADHAGHRDRGRRPGHRLGGAAVRRRDRCGYRGAARPEAEPDRGHGPTGAGAGATGWSRDRGRGWGGGRSWGRAPGQGPGPGRRGRGHGRGVHHQRDPEPAQLQLVARLEEAARDLAPVDEGPLGAPHVDDRDGPVGRHLDHRVDARDPVVVERQVRRRQPAELDDVPGELLGPQQLVAPVHLEGDGRRHRG